MITSSPEYRRPDLAIWRNIAYTFICYLSSLNPGAEMHEGIAIPPNAPKWLYPDKCFVALNSKLESFEKHISIPHSMALAPTIGYPATTLDSCATHQRNIAIPRAHYMKLWNKKNPHDWEAGQDVKERVQKILFKRSS